MIIHIPNRSRNRAYLEYIFERVFLHFLQYISCKRQMKSLQMRFMVVYDLLLNIATLFTRPAQDRIIAIVVADVLFVI